MNTNDLTDKNDKKRDNMKYKVELLDVVVVVVVLLSLLFRNSVRKSFALS